MELLACHLELALAPLPFTSARLPPATERNGGCESAEKEKTVGTLEARTTELQGLGQPPCPICPAACSKCFSF